MAAMFAALPAAAQTQPAPQSQDKPADKSTQVQGVTVTAGPEPVRTSIDRKSYDISKDLQTQSGGSIADALRNVPSVDVDLNGNVSIRGDAHVQILVDGQPSGLFKGAGAGQVLTTLPADQYERVEVLTNPSAANSPEGSGGVINLITKKTRKGGLSGAVRAAQGTRGRWSAGLSAAYKADKFSATLAAGYRYDPQRSVDDSRRQTFDALGHLISTGDQTDIRQGALHIWYVNAGANYDLDAKTQLSAEGHYNDYFYGVGSNTTLDGFDPAGVQNLDFERNGRVHDDRVTGGGSATLRRAFAGDNHDLTFVLSRDRTTYSQAQRFTDLSLSPPAPDAFDALLNGYVETTSDFKADYERPMPGAAKLKAGVEYLLDDYTGANAGFLQAVSPAAPLDPAQSDHFHGRREIDSVYATYEQPFGKFTVLAGLRGEQTRVEIDDTAAAIVNRTDRFRLYPSLHISYQIDDTQQLILSYSQRVQRVVLDELDPFVFVASPTTSYSGNPHLRDQQTQVWEAGYSYKSSGTTYLATLYRKDNQDQTTQVDFLRPDGGLLTTPQSLGRSTATGLELVAAGHLTKALSYNLSANYYRTEFDAAPLGFTGDRAGTTLSGRASLNWQASERDLFQISVRGSGRQVLPQGFTELGPLVNVGYRHKLSETLAVFVTAQDAFTTYRQETQSSGPLFRDDVHDRARTPAAFIGVTWSFGAGPKKDEGFNYNN